MGGEGSEGKGRKGGEGRGGKERGGKGRKGEGRGGNWVRSGSFSFTKSSLVKGSADTGRRYAVECRQSKHVLHLYD
jgi:hypothetical protein